MRVCHLTSAHGRYDVRIFEKECTSLAAEGYEVFLIVNDNLEDEVKHHVNIKSTGFVPSNRKERMFLSLKFILQKAKEIQADIYHLHDPELLRIVKKLKNQENKIIFDIHEDTELQIMDKEWIPYLFRRGISMAYRLYSKAILRKCNGIITVTPAIVNKMKRYHEKVELVTNYPILAPMAEREKKRDEPYILFAGGVSAQWCHERVIEAISGIENLRYKIAGLADQEYLGKLKQLKSWNQVDYLGKLPHKEIEELYVNAVAGMAVNECSQIKGEGTLGNTKLFEIMAASIPVICTNYRLWEEIVVKHQCGICVDSHNSKEIAEAITTVLKDRDASDRMGRNGREAVEHTYNWENESKKLLNFYGRILEV